MTDDARVYDLVRAAAPARSRIREGLEACSVTGLKHTYSIVNGGPGFKKDDIGLILNVCPNPYSSRCSQHLKPLKLQMTLTTRVGLLLDLTVLHPPPFENEEFARWCCQATISLLARDTVVLRGNLRLAPGVLPAFTPIIPGLEDLPRLSDDFNAQGRPVRARALPTVIAAEGEEVDVLLVIYEIDNIGPYRVVAKGKKMGALVGFTFRQPAVIRALGLMPNSRQLSSYLMYEPFQQAWTKTIQPCQTVTVCEGGGAIYRHPRVNVTLWLDLYVKHIYPDWVRQGLALHDLAAIAVESAGPSQLPAPTVPGPRGAPLASGNPTVRATRTFLALPAPAGNDKPERSLLALRAPPPAIKAMRSFLALPAPRPAIKSKRPQLALPAPPVKKAQKLPIAKAGAAATGVETGSSAAPPSVIDLTTGTAALQTRKRKRSLVGPEPLVKVTVDQEESRPRKRRQRQRQRRLKVSAKLEGKGTELDPYVL